MDELTIGARTLRLEQGDITRIAVDAIVNAGNSGLLGGGGVDGAIHRAGGRAIYYECKAIVTQRGPLPPGQAVKTTGGALPAKYVIHTVGPVWEGGGAGEAEVLACAYRESLRVAERYSLRTVAFPSISTGAFGYPVVDAVYPLLSRLKKAGVVETTWRESPVGPPRKYYRLSSRGRTELAEMGASWRDLSETVERLLQG